MENMKTLKIMIAMILMVIAPTSGQITFTLRSSNYEAFMTQVRNEVKSPYLEYHGLPMINPPSNTRRYFYINLIARNSNNQQFTIGLQLRTSDLYIVAFRDQAGTKNRGFYFRGSVEPSDVFPSISGIERQETKTGIDYDALESAAQQMIHQLQLGIESLESVMRNIYGRTDTSAAMFKRDQARFILIIAVTVAEATRFKYIAKKVDYSLSSDYQVRSMMKNWGALSTRIAQSNAHGDFRSPVTLQVTADRNWVINNTYQIKPDMGILKYERVLLKGSFTVDNESMIKISSQQLMR